MTLSYQDFINHVEKDLSQKITQLHLNQKIYSDCIDKNGHQYIDIVMEGGGVLGIALLGYVYVLERVGLRFCSIGGTSAGSITALFLAALDQPEHAKVTKLIELVANMPMASFVDGKKEGDKDAQEFVNAMVNADNILSFWNVVKGLQIVDNFKEIMGLNRGDVFHQWVKEHLDHLGVPTTQLLKNRMGTTPAGWTLRDNPFKERQQLTPLNPANNYLCLVASDVSTESRALFPQMAELYWENPANLHPADYARCSMSIPGFFKPVKIPAMPFSDARKKRWQTYLNDSTLTSDQFPPDNFVFVDGGMVSNFPIDVFHNHKAIPSRPTFGVKLQLDIFSHNINNGFDLISRIIDTARHTLDREFINKNPDFSKLISYIDTKKINWLDFNMSDETKLLLFQMGVDTAIGFLHTFDWHGYKDIRSKKLDSSL